MLGKWIEKDVTVSWDRSDPYSLECMSLVQLADQLKEKYCTSESTTPATVAGLKAVSIPEKELMVDRQESIGHEIEDLEERYLLLVTSVDSAMVEANPSLRKLHMFSKFYTKTKVTTVEELLDLLEPFYFIDYALLEKIVKFFLSQDTVADDLREYIQQLAKFKSSTTVKQFMDSIEQAQQSDSTTSEKPGLCIVKLRLVGGWLPKTMDDLEKLVNEIFKDKKHVLSHLKIVRGSVIVTYCAPLSEADSLIVLLLEQSLFIIDVGVREAVVGDTMVIPSESSDFFSFESSLIRAIQDNDLNLLMFLLTIKTSPDAADSSGRTALMYGIQFNRVNAVSQLLKANADPNLQCDDGSTSATPLYIASKMGHTTTISLLLKFNADPNFQRDDGATPIYIASQNGHTDIVSLLLKANANPNLQRVNGVTPLYIANQNGHTDIIPLLLKANADPNLQCDDDTTPLYIASQNGHSNIVFLLLKFNADPNLQLDDRSTPLYIASQEGYTDIVSLLLKANADPNLQHVNGTTPLYIASQNGHTDIISLLLKANADHNLHCDNGSTPLYIASQKGHSQIVQLT